MEQLEDDSEPNEDYEPLFPDRKDNKSKQKQYDQDNFQSQKHQ